MGNELIVAPLYSLRSDFTVAAAHGFEKEPSKRNEYAEG